VRNHPLAVQSINQLISSALFLSECSRLDTFQLPNTIDKQKQESYILLLSYFLVLLKFTTKNETNLAHYEIHKLSHCSLVVGGNILPVGPFFRANNEAE